MRSLVEQTRNRLYACFSRLLAHGVEVPHIDIVMGGDVGEEWFRKPELPAVVIGTQDMLISRALNRGYAMSRYQWPMTFAAANDDAYWVVDEVQLQGIGAVTAAQLHAFRQRFGTFHRTELTLTSATVDERWFETADFTLTDAARLSLDGGDLTDPAVKRVLFAKKQIQRAEGYDPKEVAAITRERHRAGTRTLVVVNRVGRAQDVYRQLKRLEAEAELVLLHSRFRLRDRAAHAERLEADIDPSGRGQIIVATQVIEAGVDVSAATLITDAAPWSSLVQRLGRCNRRGNDVDAACIWLDGGEPKKNDARPYDTGDLIEARRLLNELEGCSGAPADLPKRPIPLRTGLVIRKPEFFDLFDTSLDLAGHDVDVSPYIRDAHDVSASLFWRDEPPSAKNAFPQRQEICSAPVGDVREIVKTLRAAGHGGDARVGNQFTIDPGEGWTPLHEHEIRPGITIWLRSNVGRYDAEFGFKKGIQRRVEPVEPQESTEPSESCASMDSDLLAEGMPVPVSLTRHAQDTLRKANELVLTVRLADPSATIVTTAALWHDVGKAHAVFQDTMRRANAGIAAEDGTVWAKGVHLARHERRGFRHELPGALAYLRAHEGEPGADAIAYLIAAHHGKLRAAALQLPYEAALTPFQLLGIRDGDGLPCVDLGGGVQAPSITLSLESFKVGSSDGERAWVERTSALRDDPSFGPFKLAYMELLVRLADWRASAEERQRAEVAE